MTREKQIILKLADNNTTYTDANEVYQLIDELKHLIIQDKTCFFCRFNTQRTDGNVCKLGVLESLDYNNTDIFGCIKWARR